GLPLSAVMGRAEVMDSAQVGGLGGSFAGNPVACAAALQVLDMIERDDLPRRAREIGSRIASRARQWQEEFPVIGDVRCDGAMVGIEYVVDRQSREPAGDCVARLKSEALRRGVVLISAGTYSNVVRFLVPLVIDDRTLEQGLDIMEASMRAIG
ncbi:MAG: aminotransferase class III-fold pyridoxal phosphate-dependent enzyme, partial [Acidobacteria bacterium]|nr:aminotransferase class III-fold pyridoxal phosphate-dependent enzyme [Acidobacteriota bacterium]